MSKVKFGLKNVHYALVKSEDAVTGELTYDTPVRWPGAVTLTLDPSGEQAPFYADDIIYFMSQGAAGYSGTFESALVPEEFTIGALGEVKDGKGALVETVDGEPKKFAFLFEFTGDAKATRHVLYNCIASRPQIASSTKTETPTPQTETINLTASETYCAALDKNIVKAKSSEEIDATVYQGWYEKVYTPTKEGASA